MVTDRVERGWTEHRRIIGELTPRELEIARVSYFSGAVCIVNDFLDQLPDAGPFAAVRQHLEESQQEIDKQAREHLDHLRIP